MELVFSELLKTCSHYFHSFHYKPISDTNEDFAVLKKIYPHNFSFLKGTINSLYTSQICVKYSGKNSNPQTLQSSIMPSILWQRCK